MSLQARYYLKPEKNEGSVEDSPRSLMRNTVVIVEGPRKEPLYYRVLCVFKKFNNKWFMPMTGEELPCWERRNPPKLRLGLHLLSRSKIVGVDDFAYTPVRTFDKYEPDVVIKSIKASEVVSIEGQLSIQGELQNVAF